MKNYVIIGGGAAGIAAAEEMRKNDREAAITLITMEDKIHSRCMLHKYLGGERNEEEIGFIPADFFEKTNIRLIKEKEVIDVKESERQVCLDEDELIPYDKLLIASGSDYFIPPIPNLRDAVNVFGFRNMSDVRAIRQELQAGEGKRVVVIGGGLVGMDAADGLCRQGAKVTVVEMENRIMPLQADAYASSVYQEAFEKAGCCFRIGVSVKNTVIDEREKITSLLLSDGSELPCDFVVAAASVRPRINFLRNTSIEATSMNYHIHTVLSRFMKKMDLKVDQGLEVDEYMNTSSPHIYAAGDVTGLAAVWPEARLMGKIAAKNICGIRTPRTELFKNKNTCNFLGITMLSVGKINVDSEICQTYVHRDRKTYKMAVVRHGKLEGILILGDISCAGIYLYLIRKKIPLPVDGEDIFKLSFADFYGYNTKSGEFEYSV